MPAPRGQMATRGVYVFKHDSKLGNAPAHDLFDRIDVKLNNNGISVPRAFSDYSIDVKQTHLPNGVTLLTGADVGAG